MASSQLTEADFNQLDAADGSPDKSVKAILELGGKRPTQRGVPFAVELSWDSQTNRPVVQLDDDLRKALAEAGFEGLDSNFYYEFQLARTPQNQVIVMLHKVTARPRPAAGSGASQGAPQGASQGAAANQPPQQ